MSFWRIASEEVLSLPSGEPVRGMLNQTNSEKLLPGPSDRAQASHKRRPN